MNPCDKFLVQSIAEASSSIPCRPVRKAEPITAEIIGLILKYYGGSKHLLDVRFVCMCLLAFAGFFSVFLSFYLFGGLTLSLKTVFIRFLSKSACKADKYRECSWVEIAKTGNFTCPYAYLKDSAY